MKKILTIALVFTVSLPISIACKKKTTTPTTTNPTTANTNTTTTNLSIDGTAVAGMGATGNINNAGEYQLYASPTSGFPNVNITFPNTTPSGTYSISAYSTATPPATNHCYFTYSSNVTSTSTASSGVVTVTAGSPSTAVFSNITCTGSAGSHALTGAFKF